MLSVIYLSGAVPPLASQGKAFSQGCFSSRNFLSLSCCFGQACIITPPLFFWADSKHPPLPGFGLPLCPLVTLHSLPGSPPVNLGSASLPQSVSSLPAPILSPSQEIQSQVTPLCPQPGPSCLPQTRRPLPLSFFCFRTRPTVGPTTRVPSGSGCSCHPPPHPSFFSGAIRHSSQRTPVPEAVSLLVSSNWSSPQPSLPCRNP